MIIEASPDLKLRSLWLVIGYLLIALVTYQSLTSNPIDMGLHFFNVDKLYHALAYFTLMFWFALIYHSKFQRYLIAVVFVVMGCFFELLQSFNVNRYAEFADMIANFSGVVLGFTVTLTKAKDTLVKIEGIVYKR